MGDLIEFEFISTKSGMRAKLVPSRFPRSEIEDEPALWRKHLFVYGGGTDEPGFTLREPPSLLKLEPALEKLREWERLRVPLNVYLRRGPLDLSYVAQETKEVSPGSFAFIVHSIPAQLIIRPDAYTVVTVKSEANNATTIILSDLAAEEFCGVSDIKMSPEVLFKRFADGSSTIQ